jgi:hypothetical protein
MRRCSSHALEELVIHSGHEALRTARRLVARGWDYDSIVALLKRDVGLKERQARAVTARAFKPAPKSGQSLADELEAISRVLDLSRPR